MPFNANTFRTQLSHGGARPNQFEITLMSPPATFTDISNGGKVNDKFTYMANSGELPASVIGTIPVPYFGRFINVAGDRMFEDWNCAVYCDEDFALRNAFESWNNSMSFIDYATNQEHGENAKTIDLYVCDVKVAHYTKTGKIDKIYMLHNAFPYVVSPVQLSWQENDQIMMFQVSWKYDYFTTNFNAYTGTGISDAEAGGTK